MPQASNPKVSPVRTGASSTNERPRVQSPRSGEPLLRNTQQYGGAGGAPAGPMEGKYPLSPEDIFDMVERKDMEKLQAAGGVEGVLAKLNTNYQTGLAGQGDDPEGRKMRYGENRLPEQEKVTLWQLIWEALKDKIMLMLIFCAILSIVFGMFLQDPETGKVERQTGWIEGSAILISVVVVVMVSALSDYQKAKKFEELNKEQTKKPVQVIRGGNKTTIDATELLVGDLLLLVGGQALPADCLCVQVNDLKVDESAATGESDTVKKGKKDPFLLSGTSVMEGEGSAIVIGVGVNSFAGKLQMQTRKPPSETPLQVKLGKMASKIGRFGLGGAVVTWIVLCGTYLLRTLTRHESVSVVVFLDNLIVAITIVVVAIPEGLPLAVTIALAYSMRSMLKDNCLVRVLKSCETMGGCTTICSDKTGTLTTNQMTVVQGWLGGENFLVEGHGVNADNGVCKLPQDGEVKIDKIEIALLAQMYRSLALNSTGEEVEDNNTHERVWQGSKTEQGLLNFVNRSTDYVQLRKENEDRRPYPFSSERKRMTTVCRVEGKCYVHVKGAAELILEDCHAYLDATGVPQSMDEGVKKDIAKAIEQMAGQGNRVIGVAFAEGDSGKFPEDEPQPKLTLIAMLGMQDPIRKEVPEAVAACNRAGIAVRLVTGDNLHTATAIAKKCGIYKDGDVALEGREFRELAEQNSEEFHSKLDKLRIVARSSPSDKFLLVTRLMELGDIVAVTGDGTNDAPALSTADVGFAMFAGTEIAKGASDMILMDNNFASVTNAVVWGRTVNENIRKFLQFQLTTNVVGVLLTLIGSAVSPNNSSPLSPVQLLWLNLIMDTMAALALATEKPSRKCLKQKPVSRDAPLITRAMWSFIAIHAAWQLGVTMVLIYFGHKWIGTGPCTSRDPPGVKMDGGNCEMGVEHKTIIFNTFILFQVVNEFNARKLYGELNPFGAVFRRSRMMLIIIAITVGFQVFAVHVAGTFMNTVPLSLYEWGICVGIALTELPIGLLQRLVARCIPEWKPKRRQPREIEHNGEEEEPRQGGNEERRALRGPQAREIEQPPQTPKTAGSTLGSARASWRNKHDFALRAWEQEKLRHSRSRANTDTALASARSAPAAAQPGRMP